MTGILLVSPLLSSSLVAAPELPRAGQPPPVYSLSDCMQLALDRNPSILKAQRDIERTQGLVITAKATLFPQVSLNTRIEERNDDAFSQGTDPNLQRFRDYWTVQLYVTQSLYSGGVNRQQIAIAKLQHEAALIQLQATIDAALREVKYAVYALVIDEAQIDAENQTIKLLNEEEARQKALFDAGRTTRFNVLRTQVSLGNQQSLLAQTQTDLVNEQISLTQLLNIDWSRKESPFSPPFRVAHTLDCPPIDKIHVEDYITLALARRPELQVIDRQIEIGQRQIKVDKAALIPHVDAYAADEERRDQSRTSFNQSVNDYAFGLLGTWNVFDGFASKGQAITDTASLNSTEISRDALRLSIANEVRDDYARLLTAQNTIEAQSANVKIAEESVRLAQVSADTGYATLLDVLQATLDLTAARTQAIRARQLYLNAQADLERAISLKFVDWPGVDAHAGDVGRTAASNDSAAGATSTTAPTSDAPQTSAIAPMNSPNPASALHP